MSWFKVDDSLTNHPKVVAIPRRDRLAVMGLWTLAGTWCAHHLTDGHLGKHMVEELGGTEKHATALVRAGFWDDLGDEGYKFHDWNDWQPTRDSVLERRAAEAKRKAEWRDRKREKGRSHGGTDAGVPAGQVRPETRDADGCPADVRSTRPDPTRPDPTVLPTEVHQERAKTPRRAPETRLPADWQPTENHHAYGNEHRIDVTRQAFLFRNHAAANDRRQRNWNAAFTTWLAKASDYTPPRRQERTDLPEAWR